MICFWSQSNYRFFSNFTPVEILLDGVSWPSVEHFYQAQKFISPNRQAELRTASTGAKTKRLAKKYSREIRSDWADIKLFVMERALRAKYMQEPFKTLLLSTGEQEILEDSPRDLFWGTGQIGGMGAGQNHMGKLLMALRNELKTNINP